MTNNLKDWYKSTPLKPRRIILAILVPMSWYFAIGPGRSALGPIMKFNRHLAVVLVFPLFILPILFTAIIVGLFVYEFIIGIGNKIKNKALGVAFGLGTLAWVLMPVYLIKYFMD